MKLVLCRMHDTLSRIISFFSKEYVYIGANHSPKQVLQT